MRHRESARPRVGPSAARHLPVVTLVGLLLVAGCGSPSESPAPGGSNGPSSAPSEAVSPSPGGLPTTTLEDAASWNVTVSRAPDWPALLDGSLWVLAPDQRTEDDPDPGVVRLDPATGEEQARITLPGGVCEAIAAGFGSIWACTPDGMVRIDPATNAIAATITFPTPEFYGRPAVTDDAIWTVGGEIVPTDLVRIDPATNAVTGTYPLGHTVSRLAYGVDGIWATATHDGLLLRIDPASGEVTTAVADLVDPLVVTAGGGQVWVGLQGLGTDEDPDPSVPDLLRFDPATGATDFSDFDLRPETIGDIAVADVAATPGSLATVAVWVQASGPFLMRLDPESLEIESTIGSDFGTGALLVSDGSLWMTIWREDTVVRIDY